VVEVHPVARIPLSLHPGYGQSSGIDRARIGLSPSLLNSPAPNTLANGGNVALFRYLLLGGLVAGNAAAQDFIQQAAGLRAQAALYEHGRGVRQDYAAAYQLYCKAALLGDSMAAYNLGWMYFNGRGLPRQAGLAVGWFKRAAKAGDAYAARMVAHYGAVQAAEDPACQPEPPPPVVTATLKRKNSHRGAVADWVERIAPVYSIDPELVMAVIQAESGFNPSALSPKNAQGLMQLIPATAERFGVKDIWDPEQNIRGGTAYLHWLLRHFSGKVEWALAAYNAGERTVEQYQGVPPYKETQSYVKRILASYQKTIHPIPPPLGKS